MNKLIDGGRDTQSDRFHTVYILGLCRRHLRFNHVRILSNNGKALKNTYLATIEAAKYASFLQMVA